MQDNGENPNEHIKESLALVTVHLHTPVSQIKQKVCLVTEDTKWGSQRGRQGARQRERQDVSQRESQDVSQRERQGVSQRERPRERQGVSQRESQRESQRGGRKRNQREGRKRESVSQNNFTKNIT